jgi:hypothetical protein
MLSVQHSETYTYFYMSQVKLKYSAYLGLDAGDPTVADIPIIAGILVVFGFPILLASLLLQATLLLQVFAVVGFGEVPVAAVDFLLLACLEPMFVSLCCWRPCSCCLSLLFLPVPALAGFMLLASLMVPASLLLLPPVLFLVSPLFANVPAFAGYCCCHLLYRCPCCCWCPYCC